MIMRAAILLFFMVLLVAPLAIAQPRDDRLIVPGVRIGKWRPMEATGRIVEARSMTGGLQDESGGQEDAGGIPSKADFGTAPFADYDFVPSPRISNGNRPR